MAYAEFSTEHGIFSNWLSFSADRKAKREKKAEYKRKMREIDMVSDGELTDLGYCRRDLQDILFRHYFAD